MTQPNDGDVDASMEAAAAVHRGGALRPAAARVGLLRGAAEELERRADDLIAAADQESHLGPARLRNELTRTTTQLEAFAAIVADGSWARATIDTAAPGLRRMMWPIGPVVVFGASNFPFAFATPGGDTASALAAACPVVVKAHPAHPTTAAIAADAIARAVERAGLPAACFQQVAGDVAVGVALVEQPATRAVAFTGSFAAGRALFDAAARRVEPIPVYAEMGSTNPVFVLPGALGERAESVVSALADSVVLGAGQFCTNPGVIVTIDGDGFARALADALSARAPAPMLTPGDRRPLPRRRGVDARGGRRRRADRARRGGPAGVRARRRRELPQHARAAPRGLRPAHRGGVVRRRRRAGRPRRGGRRAAHVLGVRRRRRRRAGRRAGGRAPRALREAGLERRAHRGDGQPGDAARRSLPGEHRFPLDVGRHGSDRTLLTAGDVPGLPRRAAAARTPRRQPARHRPAASTASTRTRRSPAPADRRRTTATTSGRSAPIAAWRGRAGCRSGDRSGRASVRTRRGRRARRGGGSTA